MTDKQTKSNRRIGDGTPGPGRPKGIPNKATATVREAIARVLEGNVENFSRWLASVAEGERESADPALRVKARGSASQIPASR